MLSTLQDNHPHVGQAAFTEIMDAVIMVLIGYLTELTPSLGRGRGVGGIEGKLTAKWL